MHSFLLTCITQCETKTSQGVALNVAAAYISFLAKTIIEYLCFCLCTHTAYIYVIVVENGNALRCQCLHQFAFSYGYALLRAKVLEVCRANVGDD